MSEKSLKELTLPKDGLSLKSLDLLAFKCVRDDSKRRIIREAPEGANYYLKGETEWVEVPSRDMFRKPNSTESRRYVPILYLKIKEQGGT